MVFHLRRGVRFHDGSAFDAAAAKFSLDRAIDPASVNPQRSQAGQDSRGRDRRSVHLAHSARAAAPAACCSPWPGGRSSWCRRSRPRPMPCNPWARGRSAFPAGAAATRLPWLRNEDYWGDSPQLDAGHLQIHRRSHRRLCGADGGRCRRLFQLSGAGEFCAVRRRSAFQGVRRHHGDGDHSGAQSTRSRRSTICWCGARSPTRSIGSAIIDGAMFGYGTPIGSHFPPHNPAYVDLTGVYPHDVARARALLAQAGYPQGFALTLEAAAAELRAPRRRNRRGAAGPGRHPRAASRIWNGRSGWTRSSRGMIST